MIGAAIAAHFIILAMGRLQIREGGVWQYWDLLPWSRIAEYGWSDDGTLLVKCKRKFGLAGYGALPVPPERKDEVDRLIQEKSGPSASRKLRRKCRLTNRCGITVWLCRSVKSMRNGRVPFGSVFVPHA